MNKKILAVPALTLCFGALASTGAYAFDANNITNTEELDACLQNSSITCKIANDFTLTKVIDVPGNVTLDLNGKTISADSALNVITGMLVVLHGGHLTVNDAVGGGKITAETGSGDKPYAALQVTKKGETDDTNPAAITINGGTFIGKYYGIVGNGSDEPDNRRQNTSIVVNNGVIKGEIENDSVGIFHPQQGELIINGGTISGANGIYIKSGDLFVNGGAIKGEGVKQAYKFHGSGANTTGDAIVIDNCNYPGGSPSVTISSGTITSKNAKAVASYVGNGVEEADAVVPTISGGNFSTEPKDEDIAEGYKKVKNADGTWSVVKIVEPVEEEETKSAKAPETGLNTKETSAITSALAHFMLAGSAIMTYLGVKFYNKR